MASLTRDRHGLRRSRVCSAPLRFASRYAAPGTRGRTNLRLRETIAGSVSLFPACYLQGMAQLQRVAPSASGRASDHLFGLVVGLAVAAQRGRLGAGVKFREPGRDLGVLALEQAVAGKGALDQERPELVDVAHPHRPRPP